MATKPQQQQAQQPPDEFAGQGGSYVVDASGKRTLVHRTDHPDTVAKDRAASQPKQPKE